MSLIFKDQNVKIAICSVNITGWKIVSQIGSQTFNFRAGATIQAGGTLQILSGKGAQAGSNQLI